MCHFPSPLIIHATCHMHERTSTSSACKGLLQKKADLYASTPHVPLPIATDHESHMHDRMNTGSACEGVPQKGADLHAEREGLLGKEGDLCRRYHLTGCCMPISIVWS